MSEELQAANTGVVDVATSEGIATPIKMDLQLFAEGDPAPVVDSTNPEPADPDLDIDPNSGTAPDVTQTQAFAARLKESTQKAVDAEYDRLYGAEYGIHTKADYDAAIANQQAEQERQQFQEQNGFDPNVIDERVKTLLEQHPVVLSAREQSNKLIKDNAAMDIAKEAERLGIKVKIKSWEDVENLPKYEEIKSEILKGVDHVKALRMAYFDDIVNGTAQTAQQETIQKITANGQSSPGPLGGGVENTHTSISQMSKVDFEKLIDRVKRGEQVNI